MRLLLLLLLSLVTFSYASQQDISTTPSHPRKTLRFHNEIIDTIKTPSTWKHPSMKYHMYQHKHAVPQHILDATPADDNGQKHSYIVQFATPYTFEDKAKVEAFVNTTFDSYIPNDAFMIYIYAVQAQQLIANMAQYHIFSVLPYRSNVKIHKCVEKPTKDQQTTTMDILLINNFSAQQQLAMGTSWSAGMSVGVNATTSATTWNITSRNIMTINVESEDHLMHVANFLSNMDETVLIQRSTIFRARHKWARGEAQNAIADPDYAGQTGLITFQHPELQGQGEIIGCADTGLDWRSCYFHDPAFPAGPPGMKKYTSQLDRPNVVRGTPPDQQHRKIVQYVNFADDGDADGHGTHVAGTLAGNGWNFPAGSILNQFNGMAGQAKLAFFDIGAAGTGALSVPKNMDQDLFTWAYAAGARIHSNSWGGLAGGYDLNAQMVDNFIYTHPDMLILFAAGNDGVQGAVTISSPGTSKNGITVGSSMNSNIAWVKSFCAGGLLPTQKLCDAANTYPELFGDTSMSAFSSQGPTPDGIDGGRLKPEITLPGQWLLSAANNQADPATSCLGTPQEVLKKDAGTSMATPVAASLAALIRQWLRNGYYPTGVPTIENGFLPSAALLKAILISSTRPLTGKFDGNDFLFRSGRPNVPTVAAPIQLEPTPNYRQGYGRVELRNGIYFPNDEHRLLILQDRTQRFWDPVVKKNGDQLEMTFCVIGPLANGNQPKITLTWTDPPIVATVRTALVNNLDLTVTPVGGTKVYNGNEGLPQLTIPDTLNNVESVTLPSTANTAYTATVTATSLGQGPQAFALVVTGKVKLGLCTAQPVETFQWVSSSWGQCSQPCLVTTPGIQKRSVFCVSNLNGGVADSACTNNPNLGAKPAETQQCNVISCSSVKYYWQPSSYGPCTETCGGNKTRSTVCMGNTGFVATPDKCMGFSMPTVTTTCAQDPCNNPISSIGSRWVVSTCDCSAPCGGGTCTRTVSCQQNGGVVSDTVCLTAGNGPKPIARQKCNTQSCALVTAGTTPTYSWLIGDWSACSASCGGGIQTRSVRCRNVGGYLDMDSMCTSTKPITSQACGGDACLTPVEPATYNWVTGLWGPCNVQTSTMTRWTVCSTTSGTLADPATCESTVGTMPVTVKTCIPQPEDQLINAQQPTYQWSAGVFSDPIKWCGPGSGTTTRLPLCIGSSGAVAPTGDSCPPPMPAMTGTWAGNKTCPSAPTWFVGQYTSDCTNTVSPCKGVQQRHVVCVGAQGQVLGDTTLCKDVMPASTRTCPACGSATSITYNMFTLILLICITYISIRQ